LWNHRRNDEWAAVMHGYAMDGQDHEALRRLGVVLTALAAIAESVVHRSAPVRGIVLWLLGKAESRAVAFVFRIGASVGVALPSTGAPVSRVGGSGEAARLADRFRALAAVVSALSRQAAYRLRIALRHDRISLSENRRNLTGPGLRAIPQFRSFTDTS
jgi:hypothetical protein